MLGGIRYLATLLSGPTPIDGLVPAVLLGVVGNERYLQIIASGAKRAAIASASHASRASMKVRAMSTGAAASDSR